MEAFVEISPFIFLVLLRLVCSSLWVSDSQKSVVQSIATVQLGSDSIRPLTNHVLDPKHAIKMMRKLRGMAFELEEHLYQTTISLPQQRATLWRGGSGGALIPVSTEKRSDTILQKAYLIS